MRVCACALALVFGGAVILCPALFAQKNDFTFQGGGGLNGGRQVTLPQNLGTVTLQENNGYAAGLVYGRELVSGNHAALWLQVPIFAVQARTPGVGVFDDTTGVAGFIAPDAQVKLFPHGRVTPYGFFGAGAARVVQVGVANVSPFQSRTFDNSTWTLTYGGGVDLRIVRWFGVRGEVRGFYSGQTDTGLSIPALAGLSANTDQRNTVIATVGLQFRF